MVVGGGRAKADPTGLRRIRRVCAWGRCVRRGRGLYRDRKSTRLNSSHANISYAVFCLKKKKNSILLTAKQTVPEFARIMIDHPHFVPLSQLCDDRFLLCR